MTRTAVLALVLSMTAASACGKPVPDVQNARNVRHAGAGAARTVASNVQRADYAGSAACRPCHTDIATRFERSAMHRMTRAAQGDATEIRAPFDGRVFRFKDDQVTLETRGKQRFMRIDSRVMGRASYEVTKVIGGRVREDFAGVPEGGGEERVLPVSWLIGPARLRYKGYSVMIGERAGLREGAVWSQTCIFCHNTSPYLMAMMGQLAGPRAPAYQGGTVDRFLPREKRLDFEITDEAALARAIEDELQAFGAETPDRAGKRLLRSAIVATRAGFRGEHLIETGIGCESCHGGSRAHADDPSAHPTFLPTSSFLRPSRLVPRAEQINRTCARCHQVLFSRYPWTWEGGKRDSARAGGSNINSGEARDMLLGGCAKEMACSACHDPHVVGGGRFRELETAAGNDICTGCHAKYAAKEALAVHAQHSPDGPAGACVACHMPRKNMSLTSGLTRYHRIGSPTDPMRVMLDRPLECALCHADKSVEQVASDMERLFGKRYERETLRALYGDLDQNVMVATLQRGKPHEQAVALASLATAPHAQPAATALVAQALAHPIPLVREYARSALEKMLGRPCAVDLAGTRAQIATAAGACMAGIVPLAPASGDAADTSDDGED